MYHRLKPIIALLFLFASCIVGEKEYIYENSNFRVVLKEQCRKFICIELINRHTLSTYSAIPDLIIYDDGIAVEGGIVVDYNTLLNDDIKSCKIEDLYSCDSLYDSHTDSIIVVFGQEKGTHKRLDLAIYKSSLFDFRNGNYTLYAVD